jgi:PAS domain S-box-containing protein
LNWNVRFQTISRYLSLIVLTVGCAVLFGWLLNVPLFKSLLPGLVEMKVNTAFGFICAGLSLFIIHKKPLQRRLNDMGRGLAVMVMLIGGLTLSQYIFGFNLGIDELFFRDPITNPTRFPGRMATPTALTFILVGLALLLLSLLHLRHLSQPLTLLSGSLSLLALLGYVYNVSSLYTLHQNNPMALHTALAFLIVSLGILFAYPDGGYMRLLTDSGAGGVLIRRLLPLAIAIPTVLGWLLLQAQYAGIQDGAINLALFAILTIITFSILIGLSARQIFLKDQGQQHAEQQFKTLFDESLDVIMVIDGLNSRILKVNHVVSRALSYVPASLIGKHFSTLFPPKTEAEQAQIVNELQTYGHVFASQEFLRSDGSICPMDLTATMIPWKDDRAILITLRDASERKLLEAEILRAERLRGEMEKEREVTQLKEDFITMVSHDFRTPLAVIMTSRDMLERYYERLTQTRRAEQLQKIRDQVWYMTGMLDDVLLLGKARAKKLEFNPTTIDLKKVCWSVFDETRMTDNENHTFHLDARGQLGNLRLDAKLIHRILSNLLNNAVKYSPEGGIIRLELSREDKKVNLRVSDQGIGIPKKDQTRLFEPFHRGGNTSGIVGTGLGLAIVYESVEIHGGSISVQSDEGVGSIFTVCLPV